MSAFFGFVHSNNTKNRDKFSAVQTALNRPKLYHFNNDFESDSSLLGSYTTVAIKPKETLFYNCVDSNLFITGKIRLYNAREILKDFNLEPSEISSHHSLVLQLYLKYGKDSLSSLYGEYAFLIVDEKQSKSILVRDLIGIEPLYYVHSNEGLFFSNQLSGLSAVSDFSRKIEKYYLESTLSHSKPFTYKDTIFSKIKKVPPGHIIVTLKDSIQSNRFQKIKFKADSSVFDIDKLRSELYNAVRFHTLNQNKIAAHFSGGLDSTAIAAIANEISKKSFDFSITAFAITLPETLRHSQNEIKDDYETIKIIADDLGIDDLICCHHNNNIPLLENVTESIRIFPSSMGTSAFFSLLPTLISAKERGHDTILSGYGGDECLTYQQFPGYLYNVYKQKGLIEYFRSARIYNTGYAIGSILAQNRKLDFIWSIMNRKRPTYFVNPRNSPYKIPTTKFVDSQNEFVTFSNNSYSLKQDIVRYLSSPKIAQRIEIENAFAYDSGVSIRYPLLNIQLIECFLSLDNSKIILNGRGRNLFKKVVKKWLTNEDLLNMNKSRISTQPLARLDLKKNRSNIISLYNTLKSNSLLQFVNWESIVDQKHTLLPVFSLVFCQNIVNSCNKSLFL